MSLSILPPKFLLDENVRGELGKFLKAKGVKVQYSPKGASNGTLASFSKNSNLVLVTNDSDFALYSPKKVFAVVWLQIAQEDVEGLLNSFASFLTEFKEGFKGRLVILRKDSWEVLYLETLKVLVDR